MAAFLGVGLIALEVVDCGADLFTLLFAGADGVDCVPDHLKSLKRDHDFVVLNKIACKQQ